MGLRHPARRVGCVLGHLVDGLFPGLAIVLLVTGITLLGEGLNETINPVLRDGGVKVDVSSPAAEPRRRRTLVTTPVVSVRDLRVYYGTPRGPCAPSTASRSTSATGEVVGLVGESGCGKSTLGRGILGLLPEGAAADGEVLYGGRNLVGMAPKELRRLRGPDLGLIFQEPMTRLNPLMRIEDHFQETLEQHEPKPHRPGGRARRSLETLGRMGIPPTRFRQYPHEFSGGMRQRIMIALALVLRPKLLVADEPTTSLDVIVEAQILGILADLRADFGTALLLITHNLGIVAEACDRVAVMYAGQDRRGGAGARRLRRAGAPVHAGAAALDDLARHRRSCIRSPGRRRT